MAVQEDLTGTMHGLQMDRLALEERKRCIMFDDEGAGFYLVSNLR